MPDPVLSIVAPVYNEEECLLEFHARMSEALKKTSLSYELIFVDDGSADSSGRLLRELKEKDPHVRVLSFIKNFGHQFAIKAGIDHARGEAVITIDADLQDPPEAIADFLKKWKEGFDSVYAYRVEREGETLFKKWTAFVFYRTLRFISRLDVPLDAGDYRLISRRVAEDLKKIRFKNLYIRGLISWLGYKQVGIPIHRKARFAGVTKYSLRKMLGLAWNGFILFLPFGKKTSSEPLYILKADGE